jgi:hypothetical protein
VADGDEPARVDLELFPAVAARQRVRLFLNELLGVDAPAGATPLAYVFEAEPPPVETSEISVSVPGVELQTPDLEPRTYLVRVQVDGAESPLVFDNDEDSETFGRYIGPTVPVT